MTHRSGLLRHDLIWYNNNSSTRAALVDRIAHLELSADLREQFQYNNLMYTTAGYLAGQLSNTTWEKLMHMRLFEPLGMRRTNLSVARSQTDDDFAYPHQENDEHEIERIPFRNIDLVGPAGSVNSSVHEMSQWLLFNLNSGRVGDEQLISETAMTDIHSPQMTTGATRKRPEISQSTYGMGWAIDTYRGHRRVQHGGGIDGFRTSVMLFPDDDLGLVSFTNGQSGISGLVNQHAVDRILGLEPIDWIGEEKKKRDKRLQTEEQSEERKKATRVAGTRPSHPLSEYAGEYRHPGYDVLTLSLVADSLELTYNDIVAPLEHWHYDVWNGAETDGDPTFEDHKFLFRSDVDGNISAVESSFEPRVSPIVFEKTPEARLSDPDYLSLLTGTYLTPDETELIVSLSGGVLILTVPGQPTYTLEPSITGRFVLKEYSLVSLDFTVDGDRASKVLIHLPDKVEEAQRTE